MSESAAQKRSVDEVSAPEAAETKKSKADDVPEESKQGNAEAGPSTGDNEDVEETEVDEDELAALDTANIISGPRTRGKKIDFRKASEEAGGDDEDDEDDADVTANTTLAKDDEATSDDDEEEAEAAAPAEESEKKEDAKEKEE